MLRKADSDAPSKLVALIGKEPTDHTCTREPREALRLYTEASEGTQCCVLYSEHVTVRTLCTHGLRNGGKHGSEGSQDPGNAPSWCEQCLALLFLFIFYYDFIACFLVSHLRAFRE